MPTKQLKNIDEYILSFPKDIQNILEKIRQIIQKSAPKAEEAMSYGMPTFRFNGKNLVHFAAFQHHIGFYPTPSGIEAFKKEIEKYKNAKGSVQFSLEEEIPYSLIKKIVEFRVKESGVKKNKIT